MIDIAIISFAHVHILKYLPEIIKSNLFNLKAIVGIGSNKDLAYQKAEQLSVLYFDDLDEFLKKCKVDAVYIASEPYLHKYIIERLLNYNINILCDKPLATNLNDAKSIYDIVKESNINFMMPFNIRFQKPFLKMKQFIKDKGNDILNIYMVKLGKIPLNIKGIDTSWFLKKDLAGFGGFGDIGIHAIDGIRWLTEKEFISVKANINNITYNLQVDDFGSAQFIMEDGITITLVSGWTNPESYPTWLDVKAKVFLKDSFIFLDKPYHDYRVYLKDKSYNTIWQREDIKNILQEFALSIIEKRQPLITIDDAYKNLLVILKAYESSIKKREIFI